MTVLAVIMANGLPICSRFNPFKNLFKSHHCTSGITGGGFLFGNQMNIPKVFKDRSIYSEILPHDPLDAVSCNGFAHPPADSDAQTAALDATRFEKSNKVLILHLFPMICKVNKLVPL